MNLSIETIKILKNFNEINRSIFIPKGNIISTIAQSRSIYASATVKEEFPRNFAIYEISTLLSTLSLFESPDIIFEDNWLTINSNNTKVKYTYCNPKNITHPRMDKVVKLPSIDVQFAISVDEFNTCVKIANVLNLPNLMIKGSDGTLSIECIDYENPTTNIYSVDIGKTEKQFEILFDIENLKIIPNNYDIGISLTNDIGMSRFKSEDVEYFIALNMKSWIK